MARQRQADSRAEGARLDLPSRAATRCDHLRAERLEAMCIAPRVEGQPYVSTLVSFGQPHRRGNDATNSVRLSSVRLCGNRRSLLNRLSEWQGLAGSGGLPSRLSELGAG